MCCAVIFDQFSSIVIRTNTAGDFCFGRVPTYINQFLVSELFFTIVFYFGQICIIRLTICQKSLNRQISNINFFSWEVPMFFGPKISQVTADQKTHFASCFSCHSDLGNVYLLVMYIGTRETL